MNEVDLPLYKSRTDDRLKEMKVISISEADYGDTEGLDVSVHATSNGKKVNFIIQTTDGKYRSDLGCWIIAEEGSDDIDFDDYPDFDIGLLVDLAEKYVESQVKEVWTELVIDNERVYLLVTANRVDVAQKNSSFINKDTSSYQRKFYDPIATFDTEDEALAYLDDLKFTTKN